MHIKSHSSKTEPSSVGSEDVVVINLESSNLLNYSSFHLVLVPSTLSQVTIRNKKRTTSPNFQDSQPRPRYFTNLVKKIKRSLTIRHFKVEVDLDADRQFP